jgi:hypothetical protein
LPEWAGGLSTVGEEITMGRHRAIKALRRDPDQELIQMTIRVPRATWKRIKLLEIDGDIANFSDYVRGLINRNLKIRGRK